MARKEKTALTVATLTHEEATRKNIPTVEHQSVMAVEEQSPIQVAYQRRNRDLDPQLVWRGKDEQDWSDLVVQAPPLYIQEKVHPKVLIDDLLKESRTGQPRQMELFAAFNGMAPGVDRTEFYRHDQNWTNRMILGDSLSVMASLAEREGLRGKVQCIYFDPPYGIKFNSNFQWSTTSRDVKDGKTDHITREPEQVKAFRDTWRDGIHSYLTYLRDRLTVARELLVDSGSIFVQIGDENVHRVRAVMDEVFGEENCVSLIAVQKTSSFPSDTLANVCDYLCWYAKKIEVIKVRQLYDEQPFELGEGNARWLELEDFSCRGVTAREIKKEVSLPLNAKPYKPGDLTAQGRASNCQPFEYRGISVDPTSKNSHWKANYPVGLNRLQKANRIHVAAKSFQYRRYHTDYPYTSRSNIWSDTGTGSFTEDKLYIVQTSTKMVERCILMATDPGDLVLDPTCGSGTTAYVAEQWGRRWITIDTSRVALALARARIMGARYPFYLLADSPEGRQKEAELSQTIPSSHPTCHNISLGFVYERVPHITLKSIANNAEIDVIWDKYEEKLAPLRRQLSDTSGQWIVDSNGEKQPLEEWQIPHEFPSNYPPSTHSLFTAFWQLRIARQKEIDGSIAAKADHEYLYDKPYEDKKKVRVAGPFTVESLSPHRVMTVGADDELLDPLAEPSGSYGGEYDFAAMILENLKTAGVQQAHKEDRISFSSLVPWPGEMVCAEGRYQEGEDGPERRAAIFIGPEFGTVSRPDLVAAAREAGDAGFDVLIACAFNYEAHATEFNKLGRIPVLKARMNADLHMADDLKNTGKGNLFVIFGEPDISVASEEWLVDSSGKRIAPYEIFKLVSGLNSLAEINGLSQKDLRDYAQLSCRGEIWDYCTNAAGGDVNSGKYRRGTSPDQYGGISSVSWHCARVSGGAGNFSHFISKLELSGNRDFREYVERLRRDKQNAARAHEISLSSPLTTIHYSQITIHGIDVFHPTTGEVRSDGPDGIACWFIDTDYNEESFFVRHAYFLGANDPYKALKTTLKAEINEEAWASLNSDTSRPFAKPATGRIAVKVINHLGDEVMKVFRV